MREILISLGIVLACGVLLLVGQFTTGKASASADELITNQAPVVVLDTSANPTVNDTRLIAMDSGSDSEQTTESTAVTTPSGLKYVDLKE